MGTPEFACASLRTLLAGPDRVITVVCQPDRPKGRGLTTIPPPVKTLALEHDLPVLQPERARDPGFLDTLTELAPDVIVVAAYGKILPRTILDLPRHGCINVHASILPRHRGAAPIQWAILAGDRETGITIMAMNEEMDAGDILLVRRLMIAEEENAGSLTARLAVLGGEALGAAMVDLRAGRLVRTPQPPDGVTFAPRIERSDAHLDWTRPAEEIARRVRAMAPTPGAFTTLEGRTIKIHRALVGEAAGPGHPPGAVLRASGGQLVVACGAGALAIEELQLEGRKQMSAGAFLAGHPLGVGTRFGER